MIRLVLVAALVCFAPVFGCASQRIDAASLEKSRADLAQPIDLDNPDMDALSAAVELAANMAREAHGKKPLATHLVLRKAATGHARKMVKEGFFAHDDPNTPRLRTPQDRVSAVGGKNPMIAENLADAPALTLESGQPFYMRDPDRFVISLTPDGDPVPVHTYASFGVRVVEMWLDSPGHRRNLLLDDAVEQGIGLSFHVYQSLPFFMAVQVIQVREALQ